MSYLVYIREMRWLSRNLALARIRSHKLPSAVIGSAFALAVLTLLSLQGISLSQSEAFISHGLSSLPTAERTITISSTRILKTNSEFVFIDSYLSTKLQGIGGKGISRELLFHELSDKHGSGFYLGGLNNLDAEITLTSGRQPSGCDPTRCEVIQIGGNSKSNLELTNFGLVVVGHGILNNPNIFSGTFQTTPGVPILITNGIISATSIKGAESLQGANGWVLPLDPIKIGKIGVENFIESVVSLQNQTALDLPNLSFTWPEDELRAAAEHATELKQKIGIISNSVRILLLTFLVIFALRQKKQQQDFRTGLSRIGTPKAIISWALIYEFGIPLILGAIFAAVLAPLLKVIPNFSPEALIYSEMNHQWLLLLLLFLEVLSLLCFVTLTGDSSWRRSIWIPTSFVLLFGALHYYLDPQRNFESLFIPASIALAISFLAFKLLHLAIRLFISRDRNSFFILRESQSMWQGSAALLALTIALGSLAISFDSQVKAKAEAQSRDVVPLDFNISTGSTLIRPLEVGSLGDYKHLSIDAKAFPILRVGASIHANGSVADSVSVIGLSSKAIDELALELSSSTESLLLQEPPPEPQLPLGNAKYMEVTLENIPPEIDLLAWFRSPSGVHTSLLFNGHSLKRSLNIENRLKTNSALVALELRERSDYLSRRLHAQGEGDFQVPAITGDGGITSFLIDYKSLNLPSLRWPTKKFHYLFDGGSLYLRPTWSVGIPNVLVDPLTASFAKNELLTISGGRSNNFQVRVAGVIPVFPSAGERFVIMNLTALQSEVSIQEPGAIDPIEIWISTTQIKEMEWRLLRAPYSSLKIQNREKIASKLKSDPMNIGLISSYSIALLFASVLTIIILMTSLPIIRRHKLSLLIFLEAAGATPHVLRRSMLRSLRLVVLMGAGLGLFVGALISRIYLSQPFSLVGICVALLGLWSCTEIVAHLYLRRLFREKTIIEVGQ